MKPLFVYLRLTVRMFASYVCWVVRIASIFSTFIKPCIRVLLLMWYDERHLSCIFLGLKKHLYLALPDCPCKILPISPYHFLKLLKLGSVGCVGQLINLYKIHIKIYIVLYLNNFILMDYFKFPIYTESLIHSKLS